MDEPCSALDLISTAMIEDLIDSLRMTKTIVMITRNLQQAARVAQRVALFQLGELVEVGDAEQIFLSPQTERCRRYVMGLYE